MGEVALAVRSRGSFERLYAIKRLKPELRADSAARSMFLEEARLAGMLRHPNVVSVLDVGEDADGPFLVMDYVEGLSVSRLVSRSQERQELLPVQICVRVVRQVADALHAAHELRDATGRPLGLVHRDVSPQNVLVGYDGVARLADFGIAKALGRVSDRTSTGLLKGKVAYMPPEQLQFEEPDRRSDLFSLGVVLYEMLAGRRLYREESLPESARRILKEPPPDIEDERPDVPPALVELLFSMLAKERAARPASAREVARRLESILAEVTVTEPPVLLAEYLEENFRDDRDERRGEILALREAGATVVDPVPPRFVGAGEGAGRRAWWARAAVVAAVAVTAGVGGLAIGRTPSEGGDTGSIAPVEASSAPSPSPEQDAPEESASAPDGSVALASAAREEAVEVDGAEEAAREAATAAEPDVARRRRVAPREPRERRRAAPRPRTEGDMDVLWEWQR